MTPLASWLDFKLGYRMLARYPGLTVVAVLAMAFGIGGGATGFAFITNQAFPPLPYREPDRIVGIQQVSALTTRSQPPSIHDFALWRGELRSVEHVSALMQRDRSFSVAMEPPGSVAEVAVSASAFRLLAAPPLHGRGLLAGDEDPDSPPVAVISHELWQSRLGGKTDVLGSRVRIGNRLTTIVGIMDRHFAFFFPRESSTLPAAQDLWVPLSLRAVDYPPGKGPRLVVFGRLASNASQEKARAELSAFSGRMAAASPATHEHLTARTLAFPRLFRNAEGIEPSTLLSLATVFIAALVVVICGNVALLLYARAATRERELALRHALGASRARIVGQLFAESAVLAAVAIVVGLAGASVGLRWAMGALRSMLEAEGMAMPSWISDSLSPATIVYAVVLAFVGAVVTGVLPGLKATSDAGRRGLERLSGGGAGLRMGGVWTKIVVAQVALTAMLVPIAFIFGRQTLATRTAEYNLPTASYLLARVEASGDAGQAYQAFTRRLGVEEGVTGVSLASAMPGSPHDRRRFHVDGPGELTRGEWENHAQIASVDAEFFGLMQTPIVTGRGFHPGDGASDRHAIIVNESFVREILRGRNAIGRRIRYQSRSEVETGPWYTIVGVARDLAMTIDPTMTERAGIYHRLQPGELTSLEIAIRANGHPAVLSGRLRELVADVAPALDVRRTLPLDRAGQGLQITYESTFRVLVFVGLMAILLTNAGIYAVISFTVARRTREIGVRVALGAGRRQIIAVILSRTARHVALGVIVGAAFGSLLAFAFAEGSFRPGPLQAAALIAFCMASMMGVCLIACIVPTRRALAIEPTRALAVET